MFGRELAASHEEELDWALEDLFALLNEMALDGMYFGSHEGDSSDFGFWPIPDYDLFGTGNRRLRFEEFNDPNKY